MVEAPAIPGPPLYIGIDTETHLIAAGDIMPRMVCMTLDWALPGQLSPTTDIKDTFNSQIASNGDYMDESSPLDLILNTFQAAYDRRAHIIIQNAAFDLTVIMRYCMDVISGAQKSPIGDGADKAGQAYRLIWDVLDQGLDNEMAGRPHFIHDTMIRAKLWILSTSGILDRKGASEVSASLAALVMSHFGVDISAGKYSTGPGGRIFDSKGVDITDTPAAGDSWRLRYKELDGVPSAQWPTPASQYAIDDATWARKISVSQDAQKQSSGYGSMNSESLQVYADTALRIYSAPGFRVDQEQVAKVRTTVDERLAITNDALKLNGVLRPNDTVNTAVLHDRIREAWKVAGGYPHLTAKGAVCADGEVLEILAPVDPIISLYQQRAEVMKIQTSFLPNMSGTVVYTNYDILKETGRTSSYGSSKKEAKRKPLYDAVNIQQIPKGLGARQCFLPPQGYVMFSGDYGAQELCSVAQVTYDLFGQSVHRDRINAGYDLHTYLGAALAMVLEPEAVAFATGIEDAYRELNQDRSLKIDPADDSPEMQRRIATKKRAVGWRTFAKPTGLGYPGGLGPATMCTMAKGDYGLDITEDQARTFRDIWHSTYPEMRQFFNWVNRQKDTSQPDVDAYCYETKGFGRFRAGASYCATANGKGMQSLSSDASKRSVCWLARAMSNGLPPESPYSLLGDCLPLAFIHDENLTAMPLDLLTTERAWLSCDLMIKACQIHMPDVLLTVKPTIMHRWNKNAEDKWKTDPSRGEKVFDALNARGRTYGVRDFADIVADVIGPTYDPTQELVTWDAA